MQKRDEEQLMLYPSWIEIPVSDLGRAEQFYRAVFALDDTPHYAEAGQEIVVLLPSDKAVRGPGVSLVCSPAHHPNAGGAQVNFHKRWSVRWRTAARWPPLL